MSDAAEDTAMELFARVYPHEAYEAYPEAFWRFFQRERPGVPREEMERMLLETAARQLFAEAGDDDEVQP